LSEGPWRGRNRRVVLIQGKKRPEEGKREGLIGKGGATSVILLKEGAIPRNPFRKEGIMEGPGRKVLENSSLSKERPEKGG